MQASNSKEEISLQLTVLFIIFIYFDCLTDKQWKKVLTISCLSTFFCKYEHFYSNQLIFHSEVLQYPSYNN